MSEKMYGEGAEKSIGCDEDEDDELFKLEERRLLSRYGIWLMVGLCTPIQETPNVRLNILHYFIELRRPCNIA